MPYNNPYSSGAAFPNLSPQIMNFTDNLVRLKTHQEDIDMRGRALQETKRQHDLQLPIQQGNLDVARGNLAETQKLRGVQEREQQFKEAAAPQRQNFDSISAGMITDALEKFGAAEKDFTDSIKKMGSTPGVTKQMALQEILTQYPNQRQQMIDDSVANLIKNKEKDPNYVNTPKGKAHQAFIGILDKDTTGESAFGNTSLFGPVIKAMKMEEAEKQKISMDQIKAAISIKALRGEALTEDEKALVGIAPKAPVTRSVAPGGALVGPEGNVLYSNPTRPEANRPVSVAPGGTLVNPQTGAPIYTAPNKPDKGTTETELRAQRKELADNESKLLLNKTKEGAGPLADLHNERSEKPYSYQWKPGKLYGGEYVQVKLPKIKGKQVTAKDVYDTASQRGMTYDEVLRAIGALGSPPPVVSPPPPGELQGIGIPRTSIRQDYKVNY